MSLPTDLSGSTEIAQVLEAELSVDNPTPVDGNKPVTPEVKDSDSGEQKFDPLDREHPHTLESLSKLLSNTKTFLTSIEFPSLENEDTSITLSSFPHASVETITEDNLDDKMSLIGNSAVADPEFINEIAGMFPNAGNHFKTIQACVTHIPLAKTLDRIVTLTSGERSILTFKNGVVHKHWESCGPNQRTILMDLYIQFFNDRGQLPEDNIATIDSLIPGLGGDEERVKAHLLSTYFSSKNVIGLPEEFEHFRRSLTTEINNYISEAEAVEQLSDFADQFNINIGRVTESTSPVYGSLPQLAPQDEEAQVNSRLMSIITRGTSPQKILDTLTPSVSEFVNQHLSPYVVSESSFSNMVSAGNQTTKNIVFQLSKIMSSTAAISGIIKLIKLSIAGKGVKVRLSDNNQIAKHFSSLFFNHVNLVEYVGENIFPVDIAGAPIPDKPLFAGLKRYLPFGLQHALSNQGQYNDFLLRMGDLSIPYRRLRGIDIEGWTSLSNDVYRFLQSYGLNPSYFPMDGTGENYMDFTPGEILSMVFLVRSLDDSKKVERALSFAKLNDSLVDVRVSSFLKSIQVARGLSDTKELLRYHCLVYGASVHINRTVADNLTFKFDNNEEERNLRLAERLTAHMYGSKAASWVHNFFIWAKVFPEYSATVFGMYPSYIDGQVRWDNINYKYPLGWLVNQLFAPQNWLFREPNNVTDILCGRYDSWTLLPISKTKLVSLTGTLGPYLMVADEAELVGEYNYNDARRAWNSAKGNKLLSLANKLFSENLHLSFSGNSRKYEVTHAVQNYDGFHSHEGELKALIKSNTFLTILSEKEAINYLNAKQESPFLLVVAPRESVKDVLFHMEKSVRERLAREHYKNIVLIESQGIKVPCLPVPLDDPDRQPNIDNDLFLNFLPAGIDIFSISPQREQSAMEIPISITHFTSASKVNVPLYQPPLFKSVEVKLNNFIK